MAESKAKKASAPMDVDLAGVKATRADPPVVSTAQTLPTGRTATADAAVVPPVVPGVDANIPAVAPVSAAPVSVTPVVPVSAAPAAAAPVAPVAPVSAALAAPVHVPAQPAQPFRRSNAQTFVVSEGGGSDSDVAALLSKGAELLGEEVKTTSAPSTPFVLVLSLVKLQHPSQVRLTR